MPIRSMPCLIHGSIADRRVPRGQRMRIASDHLLIGGLWLALALLGVTALLGWG